MVDIKFNLDGWTVAVAFVFGFAANISVLFVNPAEGAGGIIGAGAVMIAIIAGMQAIYNGAIGYIKEDKKPGIFTHRLFSISAIVGLLLVVAGNIYTVESDPLYGWSGELITAAAWIGLLFYGGVVLALLAIAKYAYLKTQTPSDAATEEGASSSENFPN